MRIYYFFKRVIDIVVSLIGLVLLSPFLIIVAIWVKLTSKGPIIYKHTRIGKNGEPFEIYKFRSMVLGARDLQGKGVDTEKVITLAGKFIRKCFLDELLQLFNVLKGDMSLIGPRPFDKESFRKEYESIYKIKPGITGLESVADYMSNEERVKFEKKFKDLLKKDIYKNKFQHRYILDKYYVDNLSFILDIKVIFYTSLLMFKKIFSKQNQK